MHFIVYKLTSIELFNINKSVSLSSQAFLSALPGRECGRLKKVFFRQKIRYSSKTT